VVLEASVDGLVRPILASYSWSSSRFTAAIWRCSKSVILTACQRSAARVMALNMSLSTARSPNPLGMIFRRRRSSTNSRSRRLVVRIARPMAHREAQVGDAGLEVVEEACHCGIVFGAVVGLDAGGEIARDRPRGSLVGGDRSRLELRPDVLRQLRTRLCLQRGPRMGGRLRYREAQSSLGHRTPATFAAIITANGHDTALPSALLSSSHCPLFAFRSDSLGDPLRRTF